MNWVRVQTKQDDLTCRKKKQKKTVTADQDHFDATLVCWWLRPWDEHSRMIPRYRTCQPGTDHPLVTCRQSTGCLILPQQLVHLLLRSSGQLQNTHKVHWNQAKKIKSLGPNWDQRILLCSIWWSHRCSRSSVSAIDRRGWVTPSRPCTGSCSVCSRSTVEAFNPPWLDAQREQWSPGTQYHMGRST